MAANTGKKTTKIAYIGVLVALAFVFSYIEFLIPINLGIPGVKLGLPNLVIMVALYTMGPVLAFTLSIIRIVLVAFTFGNLSAMLYSLAGGVLSFMVMLIAKKLNLFSVTGVSVLGGVFHNVGQILVAMLIVETASLIYYLPLLILSGLIAGVLVGILGSIITKRLQIFVNKNL